MTTADYAGYASHPYDLSNDQINNIATNLTGYNFNLKDLLNPNFWAAENLTYNNISKMFPILQSWDRFL